MNQPCVVTGAQLAAPPAAECSQELAHVGNHNPVHHVAAFLADGEHLGSLSKSGAADALSNPFAAGAGAGPYASPYTTQLQGPGSGTSGDINPKLGLDAAVLDSLFERPSAELVSDCAHCPTAPLLLYLSCSAHLGRASYPSSEAMHMQPCARVWEQSAAWRRKAAHGQCAADQPQFAAGSWHLKQLEHAPT